MSNTPAKKYSQANLFIRSLLFSLYSLTTMVLYSFLCLLTLIFPLKIRMKFIRFYLITYMWVLKKICLIDYRVTGDENIPKEPVIILCKHQSTWETFFLPIKFHDFAVIAKRELLWIPFFGWGLAVADPIAINRNNRASAMEQIISKGKKCLAAGRSIIMFPEGTRVAPGTVGQYRLGGARLAVATKTPILPIAHNAGHCWPRRKFIKRPGIIDVVIGPPISTEGKTPEQALALTKDWIETTMLKINRLVDEPAR